MRWRKQHSVGKGFAAGAIGGLAASWIMGYVHIQLKKLGQQPEQQAQASGQQQQPQRQAQVESDETQANVKAAVAVSEKVFDRELNAGEKQKAGSAVHYAFGTLMGGLYGMASEEWDLARAGAGTLFGSALWVGSDEIAVPVLKLAKPPREYSFRVHAAALASHLVYGFTTEMIRRGLRASVLSK